VPDTSQNARREDDALKGGSWRPSVAIRLSIALHLACAIAFVAWPRGWPWLLTALVLCHLALAGAGMWPRSTLLGPNLLRLPGAAARRGEIALTFDDGPDRDVTPLVLDILDRYRAKASFFCIGDKAAAHPDIVTDVLRRGHGVENHSMRHSKLFALFGLKALRTDIGMAQSLLSKLAGRPPAFFRAPMGIRNPLLDPIVAGLGLTYTSWTRRGFDTSKRDAAVVLARLTRGLAAGDIILLHDRKSAHGEAIVLTVLPLLLEHIAAAGLKSVSLQMAMR
jgi:peptidoglycan-N-acetylglucosamine deacetylase